MSKEMVTTACIRCGGKVVQPLWRSKHKTAVKKTCSPKCCYERKGPVEKRFFEKVNKTATCWLWTGNKNNYGYGFIWFNGKDITAHRFAYQRWVAPIPKGLIVRHSCDTPSCVNPEHLICGTNLDNSADRVARNRTSKGGGHMPKHKAKALVALLQTDLTQMQIAKLLGVAIKTVQRYRTEVIQDVTSEGDK
jgi:hypothetical protein